MTKDIADVISSKLKQLEQNLIYLKQISYEINSENIKNDMIRYWGIERGIQISVECIINISNIIISVSGREKPDYYRDIMLRLSDLDVLSVTFAKKLANIVGFRNILVHDYAKFETETILRILQEDINDFIKYTTEVSKWLEMNDF